MYDAAGRRVVVQLQLREDQDPGRGHLGVCDDLEGHTHAVTCAVQLADGRVCSSSYVETIKIWDVRSGACVMTLKGHNCEQCCTAGRWAGVQQHQLRKDDQEKGAEQRDVCENVDGTFCLGVLCDSTRRWGCVQWKKKKRE